MRPEGSGQCPFTVRVSEGAVVCSHSLGDFLPAQADETLGQFMDYCTYGHMIDNVVLIVTGTLHERDVQVCVALVLSSSTPQRLRTPRPPSCCAGRAPRPGSAARSPSLLGAAWDHEHHWQRALLMG